jgi:hypothetical protein
MLRKIFAPFVVALAVLAVFGPGATGATPAVHGVYFETNTTPKNYVQVFFRDAKGALKKGPRVATGGVGNNTASPFAALGFPLLDSANSVVLTSDSKFLFAVNAGSNTISSFVVTHSGLTLASQVPSGGLLPVSIATARKGGKTLVYVVNEWSGNIVGFTAAANGKLKALAGSVQSLVTPGKTGVAAMIGFDAKASTLTVSERGAILNPLTQANLGSGPDLIDTFKIGANGLPGAAISSPSVGEDPFGFAYTKDNHLFMTDSGLKGTVATYALNATTGQVTSVGPAVDDHAAAPCWVVLTNDNQYAFVTNSLSGTISRYKLAADGSVSLLGSTPTTNNAALDEDSSNDGRYLYVLATKVTNATQFLSTRLNAFRIGAGGSLTLIGQTGQLPYPGASGLAAS